MVKKAKMKRLKVIRACFSFFPKTGLTLAQRQGKSRPKIKKEKRAKNGKWRICQAAAPANANQTAKSRLSRRRKIKVEKTKTKQSLKKKEQTRFIMMVSEKQCGQNM